MGALLSGAGAGAGFAAVSLTMQRHASQVLGGTLRRSRRRLMGWAGWILLAASPVPCLLSAPWGGALVTWLGVLTLAALPLPLGLHRWPRATLAAGPLAALLGAGLLAVLP